MQRKVGKPFESSCTKSLLYILLCAAKKSTSGAVELVEGEHDVINLGKVEGYMAAALQSLKHEYTTSVTARITPGTVEDTYPL